MTRHQDDLRDLVDAVTVSDGTAKWIDTASDPQAVDRLGEAIADLLRDFAPDAVVCWVGDNDAVLAHAIAHRLEVSVIRLQEDMGLLSVEPALTEQIATVVMFASNWGGRSQSKSMYMMLKNCGLDVRAVVSLLPGDPKPEVLPIDVPFLIIGER